MSVIEMLKKHEGLRNYPYKCSAGKWTIGYGRNFEDNPLSPQEVQELLVDRGISTTFAEKLLRNDIESVTRTLEDELPFFSLLCEARRNVLIDMCFNMGWPRLSGFKRTLKAVEVGDFNRAAVEMLDSAWAKQVGQRALTLATMMKEG